jgi:uncharacterized Tic20 family protein
VNEFDDTSTQSSEDAFSVAPSEASSGPEYTFAPPADSQEFPVIAPPTRDQVRQRARRREQKVRMWGMFAHLSALLGVVVSFPGANILGPLIFWMVKKREHPFVDEQGKQSLNFQIAITLLIAGLLVLTKFVSPIFIFVAMVVGVADVVSVIYGAIAANRGSHFRYLFAIPFLR